MPEPRAYYNENDPDMAHVLRCLIEDGLIAPGDVDDRSIKEVRPDDLREYTQCHFFAGGGLWSLAARMAGWPDDRPLWTGSCPCQPFSGAGKGLGTDDPRHLWPDLYRLVSACRPPIVMGEQVAQKAGYGWLDGVRADLAREGYASRGVDFWSDAEWIVCHDEKARRAKPGIRFLVDGLPGRIPAWRLAGNAISPVLAAEVIAAFLDMEAAE